MAHDLSHLPTIDLYTYFRSSCSARLRIALNLKSIPYNPFFVHLLKDEQMSESHRALNPSLSVPVLVIHKTDDKIIIPQSIAALEYLEDLIPPSSPFYRSLLPTDPEKRAVVRSLVAIIAIDIQPVTNLRVQRWVHKLGVDPTYLCRQATEAGFAAFEAIVSRTAGIFCFGDQITLADVCLVPAAWSATRLDVHISEYPITAAILSRMEQEDAVKKAHWRNQPDTPENIRW